MDYNYKKEDSCKLDPRWKELFLTTKEIAEARGVEEDIIIDCMRILGMQKFVNDKWIASSSSLETGDCYWEDNLLYWNVYYFEELIQALAGHIKRYEDENRNKQK